MMPTQLHFEVILRECTLKLVPSLRGISDFFLVFSLIEKPGRRGDGQQHNSCVSISKSSPARLLARERERGVFEW